MIQPFPRGARRPRPPKRVRAAQRIACLAVIAATLASDRALCAAEPEAAQPAAAKAAADLAREQEQIAGKYKRFEEVLVRMAELTAPTDPKRAALLRRAVAESKQQVIALQMDRLAELLGQDRLTVAIANQGEINKDLTALLSLLLSEERDKGLKDEKKRIEEHIRRLKELINKERQIQGQTQNGGDLQKLAQGQGKLADETAKLAEQMQPADAGGSQNATPPGGDPKKPGESQPGESQPDQAKPEGDDPSKSDKKPPAEGQPGGKPEPGKPGQGEGQEPTPDGGKSQPGQGESSGEGQPGEPGESDPNQDPQQKRSQSAQKRVQAAREKMDAARQKLEKAQREGAVEEEEGAIRELEQAKAELEEILRQLREEELERMLALLEARFRKMLEQQLIVYEGTKRLDRVAAADRGRGDEIQAGRLSRQESQLVIEAENALQVLREEGSAVAFPEAVDQMRDDMEQIVVRLSQVDVGEITQGIEEDVIAALEEMIEALQKAQQDAEKKKQQPPPEGEPQEPPLIDTLAELKMIRSLQMRVNTRTKRFSRLVDEGEVGQADKPDVVEQLRRLAEREQSVFRTTRDIVTGKNK